MNGRNDGSGNQLRRIVRQGARNGQWEKTLSGPTIAPAPTSAGEAVIRTFDLGTLVAWLVRRVPEHSISFRDLQTHLYLIEWFFVQRTGRSLFGFVWVNDGQAIHGIGIRKELVACQKVILPNLTDLDGEVRLMGRILMKPCPELETIIEAYTSYNEPPRDSAGLYALVRETFPCRSMLPRETFTLEERKLALRRPPAPNQRKS